MTYNNTPKPIEKVIEELSNEHENPDKIKRDAAWIERAKKREQTPQEKANWFQKGNVKGRPKGSPNKSTRVLKETISLLVNKQSDKVDKLMNKLAKEDPAKFVDLFIKLAEFIQPKLSRTEVEGNVQHTTLVIGKPADLILPQPANISELENTVRELEENTGKE